MGFGAVVVAAVLSAMVVSPSVAEPEPPSIVWLATGDSYSSGTGVEGRSGSCRRADEAYAPRVRQRLEADGWDIRGWAFTACHGATISRRSWEIDPDFNDTVVNAQTLLLEQVGPVISVPGEPPVKADLMTFTFGGNDIHFSRIIRRCAGITLDPLTWWDPRCPYTEEELRERVDALEDGNNLTQRGDGIRIWDEDPWPGSLAFFYRQAHERHVAEDGTLIVVGYPRLFAPSQDWTGPDNERCEGISREDADMLGRVAEHLDEVIARQTARAAGSRHDIRYVSVRDAFRQGIPSFSDGGHELCGTGTPWLTGWQGLLNLEDADFPETTPELIEDEPEEDEPEGEDGLGARDSYHPNADGHAAMAELLYRELLSKEEIDWPEPEVPDPRQVEIDGLLRPNAEVVEIDYSRLAGGPGEDLILWSQSEIEHGGMTRRVDHVDVYSWRAGDWQHIFNANEHQAEGHPLLEAVPEQFAAQLAKSVGTIDFDGDGVSSLVISVQSAGAVAASGDVWVIDLSGAVPRTEFFGRPLRSLYEATIDGDVIRVTGLYEPEYGTGGESTQVFTIGWDGEQLGVLEHAIQRVITLGPDGLGLVHLQRHRDLVVTELTAALGPPLGAETYELWSDEDVFEEYEDVTWEELTATFHDDRFVRWETSSSRFSTREGVAVGDSLSDVQESYPDAHYFGVIGFEMASHSGGLCGLFDLSWLDRLIGGRNCGQGYFYG